MAIFMQKYILIIVANHMLGGSGAYASSLEKIRKMWYSLVHFGVYFDQCVWKNSLKINIFQGTEPP